MAHGATTELALWPPRPIPEGSSSLSNAREEILDRIRAAVGPAAAGSAAGSSAGGSSVDGPAAAGRAATPAEVEAAYAALPRDYRRAHHDAAGTDIVALFAERAADYRAVVERVPEADLPAAIARVLAGVPRFLVPDGLPPQWLAGLSPDGPPDGLANAGPGGQAGLPRTGSYRTTRRCPPANSTRWPA